MVVIALCVALMGGYWWIQSHQATARLVPPAPAFMVEVASDGLTVRKGSSLTSWMRWEDISVVRSFKVDCYTFDQICVAVESRAGESVGFVMSEEHPQFEELLGAFAARLPGFDTGWFLKVAFPAFETCETVIYQSASP